MSTGQGTPAAFAAATFDPAAYSRLVPTELDFDLATGELSFSYELAGEGVPLGFTERLVLPVPDALAPDNVAALTAVLGLAHLVGGISYAKAAGVTTVEAGEVTAAELEFLRGVYRDGMAEFAYTNDLPAVLDTEIEATVIPDELLAFDFDAAAPLVACGGGKDSIVSLEALRRSGRAPRSFVVNPNAITSSVVERSGTPLLAVTRKLDPLLFEINSHGAYNGHVPVTAFNSLLGVAVSVLHGLGPVVMSNESSASAPNLEWHGRPVNHQWSKGADAERLLRAALASRLGPDAELYFSLLRHLNELSIAALFAKISGYDDVVTSCNRAFTITKASGRRWCRDCPKCRFVFLALAPFLPRERLVAIFDGDMLRDEAQLTGYRELLGLIDFKPFECVGELDESLAAVVHLAGMPEWSDAAVVRALADEITTAGRPVPSLEAVLAERSTTLAPAEYVQALDVLA